MKNKKIQHQKGGKNPPKVLLNTTNDNRKYFLGLAIILIITSIVYLPSLHNGFIWDDSVFIKNNDLIKDFSWKGIKAIFIDFSKSNYAPITVFILALQNKIGGLNPTTFHIVSLIFHLLNICLVFWFVNSLSIRWHIAAIVSLFFGIHPMQVESVAWAAGGSTLYFAAFSLCSLIAYLYYCTTKRNMYLFLSLLFFMFSILSKAMAVMLPFLLLLLDYYLKRKITLKVMLEKVPYFVLSISVGIIAIILKNHAGSIQDVSVLSLPQRLVFGTYGFLSYLFKILVPISLSAFYPYPIRNSSDIPVLYYFYLIGFLAFIAFAFYSLRFTRKIFFGIGFFAISIFLVLQILPVGGAIIADRYIYVASIGIFFLFAEGLYLLWNKKYKIVSTVVLAGFSIFFIITTHNRSKIWNNEIDFWNEMISKYQTIPEAYYSRGVVLFDEKKFDQAIPDFNKTIELNPNYVQAYINRGDIYIYSNKFEEALADFNKAIQLRPDFELGYYNRGVVFYTQKKYKEALTDYNKAIALKPDYAQAIYSRGLAKYYTDKKDSACLDIIQAGNLGYPVPADAMKEICK
jgi:protein O-mannosyl-transferase